MVKEKEIHYIWYITVQLTQKRLDEALARNPDLSIQVQGGKSKETKQKENKAKYGNHKVYEYDDGYVSGEKGISGHGNIKAIYDSTKEYCRWLDLQLMEKAGAITKLERQKDLVIQDGFVYEGKRIQKIVYKADFSYINADGVNVIEDVKGFDKKSGHYMQTEAFRLKWKLLKAKHPDYHFVLY